MCEKPIFKCEPQENALRLSACTKPNMSVLPVMSPPQVLVLHFLLSSPEVWAEDDRAR